MTVLYRMAKMDRSLFISECCKSIFLYLVQRMICHRFVNLSNLCVLHLCNVLLEFKNSCTFMSTLTNYKPHFATSTYSWHMQNMSLLVCIKQTILDKPSKPYSFTKFASNATFLSCWIPSECMFTAETRAQRAFLKWIIDLMICIKEVMHLTKSCNNLGQTNSFRWHLQ